MMKRGNFIEEDKAEGLFSYDAEMVCADFVGGARGSLASEHNQVIASGKKRGGQNNLNNLAMAGLAGLQNFPAPDDLAFRGLYLGAIAAIASIFDFQIELHAMNARSQA
jgi:hypothetical protein